MEENLLKKRLIYKSCHRGSKETDLLLGSFTKKNIETMSLDELIMLDAILDEPDLDIYSWISHNANIPQKHNNVVMNSLLKFKFKVI